MAMDTIVDGVIDLIRKNLIAKTNVSSNVVTGDTNIFIENSYHFFPDQEIVLIDYGYNIPGHVHYQKYEYAVIKEVSNTNSIVLKTPVIDNWLLSDNALIQKTIGHSPLFDDRVYYGDRDVIPTDEIAITVDPSSQSTEWIYIQGGLSRDYKLSITVYGKEVSTEAGSKILNKYADAIQELLNRNIHIDVNNYESPLLEDASIGDDVVVVANTVENSKQFVLSSLLPDDTIFEVQDNRRSNIDRAIVGVNPVGGNLYITLDVPLTNDFNLNDYAVLRRHGDYIYDSRVTDIEYGNIQKGSSLLRAAKLSWFGKMVTEYHFPQVSDGNDFFNKISP